MKTFILVCNVLLPISLLVGLMLWIFRPQIEKEFALVGGKDQVRNAENKSPIKLGANVPKENASIVLGNDLWPLNDVSLQDLFAKGLVTINVPKASVAAPRKKASKVPRIATAAKSGKELRVFPAEAKFVEFFNSDEVVDSSVWKPSYGWPTRREIKWLVVDSWGEFIQGCCDFFKIPACADDVASILSHESSASPFARNKSSGALGPGQIVYKTGKNLSIDKRVMLPLEHIDRTSPEQNILMIVALFRHNMDYFRAKGYDNYRDWAKLAHYTGLLNAEDTAAYYGGLYQTPFLLAIGEYTKIKKPVAPPLWAQKLWQDHDWATIERIRQLAMGRPRSSTKANLVLAKKRKLEENALSQVSGDDRFP